MALEIVKWTWDFGNGETSNSFTPSVFYRTGFYDVTLIGEEANGTTYTTTKTIYIQVGENDQALTSSTYLENYKSLHFGWKDEHGFGWSENERPDWVLPFTSSSIYNYEENGVVYTIVWDGVDGKPYIINTRDDYTSSASYKDKENADGTGGIDIPTTVIFPELTGEMTHYDISHLETNVMFRPEILRNDYLDGFQVDFSLITESREESVEVQYNQDIEKEILFYYQNNKVANTRTRQLKVDTNTSRYQLLNFESYFKIDDRFKRPFGELTDTQNTMAKFGSMALWFTRGKGYGFDRVTKDTYDTSNQTKIIGVDGKSGSGVSLAIQETITFDTIVGIFTLWAKQLPAVSGWTEQYDKGDGWKLYKSANTFHSELALDAGDYFDIRCINPVALEDLDFSNYVDKLEQFLPGY